MQCLLQVFVSAWEGASLLAHITASTLAWLAAVRLSLSLHSHGLIPVKVFLS